MSKWNELTEEQKYRIWSTYYSATANPFDYSKWCDLMDSAIFE